MPLLLALLLVVVGWLGLFSVVVVLFLFDCIFSVCPEEQSEREAWWCLVTYQC